MRSPVWLAGYDVAYGRADEPDFSYLSDEQRRDFLDGFLCGARCRQQEDPDDSLPLAPVRGVANGLAIGVLAWLCIIGFVWKVLT